MDKTSINLKDYIGVDTVLKKVASTRGGEYAGSCPFCGGIDRFHVQPNYKDGFFFCRQCGASGDIISYVMRRNNLQFKQAMELLGLPLDQQPRRNAPRPAYNPNAPHALGDYAALDDTDWQESARVFCERSFEQLWSKDGRKALDWLKARGLPESTIEAAGLGYNPEDTHSQWGLTDVFLDRGIVIPWMISGKFWRVNIRRPVGEPKYRGIKGGANGLYNADAIGRDDVVLMVEGEFDALIVQSYIKGVTPVATGTVAWGRVLRWVSVLSTAQLVINAFDADELTNENVKKAVGWWRENLGDKFIRLMPTEHDVTDMWKTGKDLQAWVEPYSLWYDYPTTEAQIAERMNTRNQMISQGWQLREVM